MSHTTLGECVSRLVLSALERGQCTEGFWCISEYQLLVSWVQYVDVLIYAGVFYVPKLKETVLILDPSFTLFINFRLFVY